MRGAAASLVLTATLGARAFAQPVEALPADYKEMVARYVSGDRPSALALLAAWDGARLERATKEMHAAVIALRKCAGCPERAAFARFPLRAAILLHADREIQEQFG